jgi:acyl-coenzyme A thioesterase PaaI-like protein
LKLERDAGGAVSDTEPEPPHERLARVFADLPDDRVMGRGHAVGDHLEAFDWELLERGAEQLRLRIHLPPQVRNPRGQLFGGFTPTYVDLIAILTIRAAQDADAPRRWLATVNMRVDYLEPITDGCLVDSHVVGRRGRTRWVETRFLNDDGTLLAFGLTTMREVEEMD